MRILISLLLGLMLAASVYADDFTLKSDAYVDKGKMPVKYTCDGKSIPPELSWTNAPAGTKSFALIMSCPDPSIGGMFYLWVLYNIPADTKGLPEGGDLPAGTLVGVNTYDDSLYIGPCPPDNLIHHYNFTLYALDQLLFLPSGSEADDLYDEMKHHILGKAELGAVFSH
jgi:Raf kinase inhibitor-like YbhB/YbcL family protein